MIKALQRFIPLILVISILSISAFKISTTPQPASDVNQEKVVNGVILSVLKDEKSQFDNREYSSQTLQVEITSGSQKNQIVSVNTQLIPKYNATKYQKNDYILLGNLDGQGLNQSYYVIGYSRTFPLLFLVLLFVIIALIVARKKGLYALLGMTMSLLILTLFVLPAIATGTNALMTTILGIIILIPVLFYISHGVNTKTTIAVLSSIITLSITASLAVFFVNLMHLTGVTLEEVETLLYINDGQFDMQGVLLAGIVMGVLGVIDDVAITQASLTREIYQTNKSLSKGKLINKSMNVGRDHIASVINTLILVYVGGSLTTLLLFTQFPRPLIVLINDEVVLIPIVIALIGSIGLILAIPITTILSAWITHRSEYK